VVEALAQLTLFADLTRPQLEKVAHTVGEEMFAEGQRVLRQGMQGGGLFIILDGEARVVIDPKSVDDWAAATSSERSPRSPATRQRPTSWRRRCCAA
jgi:signal-transduction protein with cAMP-binding, CBS, and nucleotidyltransferase domain